MKKLLAAISLAAGLSSGASAQGVLWVVPTNVIQIVPNQTIFACITNNTNFQVGFTAQFDGAWNAVNVYLAPRQSTAVLGTSTFGLPGLRLTYNDQLSGGVRSYAVQSNLLTTANVNWLGQVNCQGSAGGYFFERNDPWTGRIAVDFTSYRFPF